MFGLLAGFEGFGLLEGFRVSKVWGRGSVFTLLAYNPIIYPIIVVCIFFSIIPILPQGSHITPI